MTRRPGRRKPWPAGWRPELVRRQEGIYELLGVESHQVLGAFPQADQFNGDAELAGDSDGDTAFGRTVHLRQNAARDTDGVGELAGLDQAILPGGGVYHQ